jgi:putative drug exporter of the RND superfamily
VLFSGVTVAAGLLSLFVLPVPELRSIGLGSMIVPVVSVVVTLTLLSGVLATVGERADWPRRHKRAVSSRAWRDWAGLVIRHRWIAALTALAVLALLGSAALGIRVGEPAADSLGTTGPPAQPLLALEHAGVPAGCSIPSRF